MAAQMSTSVQNITEVVIIVMLSALTPWAAIGVSVNEDSPEMEKTVRVSSINISTVFMCSSFCFSIN